MGKGGGDGAGEEGGVEQGWRGCVEGLRAREGVARNIVVEGRKFGFRSLDDLF